MGTHNILPGNDAIRMDMAWPIDIRQEKINGFQPLEQSLLKNLPFAGTDQTGERIEREDALDAKMTGVVETKGGSQAPEQHPGGSVVVIESL
jgi:hypothetical protein